MILNLLQIDILRNRIPSKNDDDETRYCVTVCIICRCFICRGLWGYIKFYWFLLLWNRSFVRLIYIIYLFRHAWNSHCIWTLTWSIRTNKWICHISLDDSCSNSINNPSTYTNAIMTHVATISRKDPILFLKDLNLFSLYCTSNTDFSFFANAGTLVSIMSVYIYIFVRYLKFWMRGQNLKSFDIDRFLYAHSFLPGQRDEIHMLGHNLNFLFTINLVYNMSGTYRLKLLILPLYIQLGFLITLRNRAYHFFLL